MPRDSGTTMVEVVVAALLLGLMATIGTSAVLQGQSATVANRSRVAAASLAARELDFVRQQLAVSPAAATALVEQGVVTDEHPVGAPDAYVLDGMTYTVQRVAVLRSLGDTSPCEGGSEYATKLATEVAITVTWESMGGAKPYVLRQLFAPHRDTAPAATDALIAVAVTDHRSRAVDGVQVTVSDGSQVHTASTDASGCAVLSVRAAPAGSRFDLALSSTSGHVDPAGNPTPSSTLYGVVPAEITRASFTYAAAGTLTVHLANATESSQVTLIRPNGTRLVRSPDAGSGGTRITITDAYPGTWGAYPGAGDIPDGQQYPSITLEAGSSAALSLVFP